MGNAVQTNMGATYLSVRECSPELGLFGTCGAREAVRRLFVIGTTRLGKFGKSLHFSPG